MKKSAKLKMRTTLVVFVVLILAGSIYEKTKKNEIEIEDLTWKFDGDLVHAEFQIVNRTELDRIIALRLKVESYTSSAYDSNYIFLGMKEFEYQVEKNSARKVEEKFEQPRKSNSPHRRLSMEIISNQAASQIAGTRGAIDWLL